MRSDGFNRIFLFGLVGVRIVPLKTHDFKRLQPDFNRILTGLEQDFNRIPWNLVKVWLRTA